MESRLENCLRSLKAGNESTEQSKNFFNDLACILLNSCGIEVTSNFMFRTLLLISF
jgi:hypothetical protein